MNETINNKTNFVLVYCRESKNDKNKKNRYDCELIINKEKDTICKSQRITYNKRIFI